MKSVVAVTRAIDTMNDTIGRHVAWLALLMVLVQFIVVVMRYVYGIGSIAMQESIIYMHGILFLTGAGYTLLHNGHVRVDIFYREASVKAKAWVDFFGVLFFLIPVTTAIWWTSWGYVASSWRVFEGSQETSGIQAVFLLKTAILVFCVLIVVQGISMALHALLTIVGYEHPVTEQVHEGV